MISKFAEFLRSRFSLAFPIIGLLGLVALAAVGAAYFINVDAMRSDMEAQDADKSRTTQHAVESSINEDLRNVRALATALQFNSEIGEAFARYLESRTNIEPLRQKLDEMYPRLDVAIFELADPDRRIVYRAGEPAAAQASTELGAGPVNEGVSVAGDANGLAIRTTVPLYWRSKIVGYLTTGLRIDDAFAEHVSRETGSTVTIASDRGILGSALPADRRASRSGSARPWLRRAARADRPAARCRGCRDPRRW